MNILIQLLGPWATKFLCHLLPLYCIIREWKTVLNSVWYKSGKKIAQAFTFSTIYTILENMVLIQTRSRRCAMMNANTQKKHWPIMWYVQNFRKMVTKKSTSGWKLVCSVVYPHHLIIQNKTDLFLIIIKLN